MAYVATFLVRDVPEGNDQTMLDHFPEIEGHHWCDFYPVPAQQLTSACSNDDCCVKSPADCAAYCIELGPTCIGFGVMVNGIHERELCIEEPGPADRYSGCVLLAARLSSCGPELVGKDGVYRLDFRFRAGNKSFSPPPPPATFPPPPLGPDPLPPLAIAGIVLLCCILLVVIIWLLRRRRAGPGSENCKALLCDESDFEGIPLTSADGASMALTERRVHDAAVLGSPVYAFDVFLSYRRLDFSVVDLIACLLELESLRVFKDRSGLMVGRPFDQELLRALSTSAVFVPVITLRAMQRLHDLKPGDVDFTLAEYILALQARMLGTCKLLVPLLVGEEIAEPSSAPGAGPARDLLSSNRTFRHLRATLPDTVPRATLDVVAGMLRTGWGQSSPRGLLPCLQNATIREIMLASDSNPGQAPQLRGVLMHEWSELTGLQQHSSLYIRGSFAANIKRAFRR